MSETKYISNLADYESMHDEPISKTVSLKLLIPDEISGTVLGKKGDRIKQVRNDHQIAVNMNHTKGRDRIIELKSDKNSPDNKAPIVNAIADILNYCEPEYKNFINKINKNYKKDNDKLVTAMKQEGYTEVRVLMHTSVMSKIIGDKGSVIKQFRADFEDCWFNIYKECCPGSCDRVIKISGEIPRLQEVLNQLITIMCYHECTGKYSGDQKPYRGDYDPSFRAAFHRYGGFDVRYSGKRDSNFHDMPSHDDKRARNDQFYPHPPPNMPMQPMYQPVYQPVYNPVPAPVQPLAPPPAEAFNAIDKSKFSEGEVLAMSYGLSKEQFANLKKVIMSDMLKEQLR